MPPERRVLVVGTTPDYIAYIDRVYPKRALFLTDAAQREASPDNRPDDASEIVCELAVTAEVTEALQRHLERWGQRLSGVVGFDCEWLRLAAELAAEHELPFPSEAAVALSRNKHQTKRIWQERGIPCPKMRLVQTANEAVDFLQQLGGPLVLKPLSGAGSELTFRCNDAVAVRRAFQKVAEGLSQRHAAPMYQPGGLAEGDPDPRTVVLAEEFVEGEEYSCDFVVDGAASGIIRTARKLRGTKLPFGTTIAYEVPAHWPDDIAIPGLESLLAGAARALGLERAVCMIDILARNGEIVLLELTPRIGGDCLPPLVRRSSGLDTIGLALDFAEGKPPAVPSAADWRRRVGLRLFSDRAGILTGLDVSALTEDPRVEEIGLRRTPGDRIQLPPRDYDSWLLGHVIFKPSADESLELQCRQLRTKLVTQVERYHGRYSARVHTPSKCTAAAKDSTT